MSLFDRAVSLTLPAGSQADRPPLFQSLHRRVKAGRGVRKSSATCADRARWPRWTFSASSSPVPTRPRRTPRTIWTCCSGSTTSDSRRPTSRSSSARWGCCWTRALPGEHAPRCWTGPARRSNFIRIDMEDRRLHHGDARDLSGAGDGIPRTRGLVLQSRLRRTLDDVEALAAQPANFRLCKGIYLEPRKIAYTDPELIRRNFVLALDRMFEHGGLRRASRPTTRGWSGRRCA